MPIRSIALLVLVALAGCDSHPTALPAQLTSTLATIDFGYRAASAPPTVRAVSIENVGGTTSPPLSAAIEGSGKVAFRIDSASSSCIGQRLAPTASCAVLVSLGGPASGPVTASLVVGGTGDEDPRTVVALTGTIESQLTIYAQGAGHGFVFESEHNTSCVPTCGMSFDVPTVTLTAQADPVSTFVGWTGVPGCSTDPSCTLTLIDLNVVTVEFDPAP